MNPPLCTVADCRSDDVPRLVTDNGYICGPCRRNLRRWIGELALLHLELGEALIPGSGGMGGRPSYRIPWPVNPAVVGLSGDVYGKLASWALLVIEELGVSPPHTYPGEVRPLARWLMIQTDRIAHREWAAAMHREIRDLYRIVYAVTSPARDRKRFPLPRWCRCPECAGDLFAHFTPIEALVECTNCGQIWQHLQWHRLGRILTSRRVSA